MFERFDLVEAYDSEGWWPGVVSAVRRGRWPRYTVTFPLFREEVELSKSLVRPRREFVCGTWIDAQVLRGIPLYKEGSSVEVMCDKKKQGTAWMLATIIKMVGGTNYVVTYGNEECSTEILHSRFVRQQPVFDMKFEYELEPSTEVEVYQDGIWTRGVIADVSISEPRRYGVRIKRPYSTDEDDYLFVSRVSLRPYSKWDEQKSWPSLSKKRGRKEDYAVCPEGSNSPESSTSVENSDEEFCSAVTSKANRDTDQYRSVPNKEPQLKRSEDENPEMCQEVIEGKDKMDGTCREGDTISLANSENYVEAFSDGKLKPSSPVQQDVNADLLSMQVPYSSKRKIRGECTSMCYEEVATFPVDKVEPYLSSPDVKADLLFMQASNDDKMEIKHERTCMSAKGAPVFYHQTYMKSKKIADASLNHPLGQYELSISKKSKKPSSSMRPGMMIDLSSFMPVPATTTLPTVFSAGSLLLMPEYKMEVFKLLPQKNLHFHEVWNNYPRELREGQALGLMLSFANMAESIKNIRVEDDPQLYQEKMRSLLDLEDNGFEVGALKDRLDNLLCLRYHQIDLKKMKAHLNNEVLKLEISNTEVEQRLKFIRMYMMGLGEEPPQFRELTMQKSVNSSNILKLQDELHQVEDSLMSVEADFNNAAAAPWCLNAGPSVSTTVSNQ
ncbi:hypothetical protein QOZ80_1AG0020490 [Eleusine coracana subsp. coracana]|nr:hypothetical protein QOZ80_1AG0020490 [Eleusine coracana subsp. coracana]